MPDASSKQKSFIFLSLLCFSLADVRDGLGPFFGVYLQEQGWMPDEIGFVMTAGGLVELVCTTPLGVLADHTRNKRGLIAASVALIMVACGMIFSWNGAAGTTLSKVLSGAAAAAIAPALTGVTLGMTGQQGFPARLGRNEAWPRRKCGYRYPGWHCWLHIWCSGCLCRDGDHGGHGPVLPVAH